MQQVNLHATLKIVKECVKELSFQQLRRITEAREEWQKAAVDGSPEGRARDEGFRAGFKSAVDLMEIDFADLSATDLLNAVESNITEN